MKLIRTQNNVPSVYVDESRDFQLLCRLYDCLINGVKFDIDSMTCVTDTKSCNARLLKLLQTKLGFFSDIEITDDDLRYILLAFPEIIKNKGSVTAIEQALYVFMKINHIDADIEIRVYGSEPMSSRYTVQIGLRTGFRDTTVLDEVLKYVIPAGYGIEYVFYSPTDAETDLIAETDPKVKYVQNATNSIVRGSDVIYTEDNKSDNTMSIIGTVDTMEVISSDSPYTEGYYSNGNFYYDKVHTDKIVPIPGTKYKDKTSSNIYEYNGDTLKYDPVVN